MVINRMNFTMNTTMTRKFTVKIMLAALGLSACSALSGCELIARFDESKLMDVVAIDVPRTPTDTGVEAAVNSDGGDAGETGVEQDAGDTGVVADAADVQANDTPNADVPNADVPNADVPNFDVPNRDVPDNDVPNAPDVPDNDVPDPIDM